MTQDPNHTPTEQLQGRQGLYIVANKSSLSIRQTRKLIESLDIIYGFDLAQVILLISKSKISGYLNIISEKNEIYGVSFSEGEIVQIDNRDEKTYIGQLLITDGYITEVELKNLLKNKESRLGQELIRSKKMSTEQLVAVLLKQTILRLTQLINSKSIQISFTNADVENNDIKIAYPQLVGLSFDWVFSCITDQWLNTHYFEFKNSTLKLQTEKLIYEYQPIYTKLIDAAGKDFIEIFARKPKIRQLEFEILPKTLLRMIHQLVLIDCIEIQTNAKNLMNEADLQSFLRELHKGTPEQKLNSLAIFTKSSMNEVDVIYEKLLDKLSHLKIDADLKNNLLKVAMDFLLNPEQLKLARILNESADKEATLIKNIAKDLIYAKKYFEAFTILKKLDESQMKTSKIELYGLWCLIGQAIDSNAKIDQSILRIRMNKIRPEDRYDAEYFYVLALYNKYLKKPIESQQYYIKSCSMNPRFKEFRISEDTLLSKIKGLFKFSLIFIILGAAQNLSSEIVSAPIRFTNQYYQYEVTGQRILIAGIDIDTNDLSQTISDLNLVQIGNCYVKKTENTNLKICNSPKLAVNSNLRVFIANQPAENSGTVILQDLKEYINLKVVKNRSIFLDFSVRRRAIAPYKIQKEIDSNKTQFTFLDLNNRKNIWDAELDISKLTFRLESITEPYLILQDYVYESSTIENEAIDFTMKLPTEVQFSYNRIGLNALAGFSSFETATLTFKSTLNSAVGKGMKLLFERNLDTSSSIYTNLIFYTAIITDERNAIVVINKNFTLLDFNLGYKIYYDLNWALSYEFNFRNNFATKENTAGSSQFEINQSYGYSLGLTPEYTFLESRRWNFVLEASPSVLFPQKTAYGQTAIGYAWGLGLKSTYKMKATRIYAGLNYEDRTFNSPDAKYKNKDLIYSVGFYYLL